MAAAVCTPEGMPVNNASTSQTDELEYLSSATLTKRKDFLDREEEARGAPNRVLYYRRNADHGKLIAACTKTLEINPRSVRALLLRGSSFIKQGGRTPLTYPPAISTYSSCAPCHPNCHIGMSATLIK